MIPDSLAEQILDWMYANTNTVHTRGYSHNEALEELRELLAKVRQLEKQVKDSRLEYYTREKTKSNDNEKHKQR